jgi:hypothetical protein
VSTANLAGLVSTTLLSNFALNLAFNYGYVSTAQLAGHVSTANLSGLVSTANLAGLVSSANLAGLVSSANLTNLVSTANLTNLVSTANLANLVSTANLANLVSSANLANLVSTTLLSSFALNLARDYGYISSTQLQSTVLGLNTYINSFIDPTELTSSVVGLGTAGFISTLGLSYALASTVTGLGTANYVSTSQLLSTTVGVYTTIVNLPGSVSGANLTSTVTGLGTASSFSSFEISDDFRLSSFGSPLSDVITTSPEIRESAPTPEFTRVLRLDRGRIAITDAVKSFDWDTTTCLTWQRDGSSLVLIQEEGSDLQADTSNRVLIATPLRRILNITPRESVLLITTYSPVPHVKLIPVSQIYRYLPSI